MRCTTKQHQKPILLTVVFDTNHPNDLQALNAIDEKLLLGFEPSAALLHRRQGMNGYTK
ncbi:MAG: hypothetical protein QXV17_04525 [Candidatus Micrarchaeaceae archaeon]